MLDNRRRADGRVRSALAASVLLHAAVVAFAVAAEGSAPEPPKTKVYAVDIVSPPPNVAGEPPREALSNQEPGPAAPAQPAAPAPSAAEPDPPAPDPEPAPPRDEAPKEPAKAPEPRRTPERPPQRPAATPGERPKANTPPRPTPQRPATTPATNTNRPTETPEKSRPATNRPTSGTSGQSGTGSGSTRTRGDGTSTAAATGSNPQPNSPGGEGINIHVEGDPCPVSGYCERVTLQVQRYFRAPPDNAGARGEVCFRIQRDGSVTEIQARGVRGGGAAFRLAMMEAAEAAGSRRAFGTLPAAFDPQRWRWCVELTPR